ncbi:MAG: hypothetical protein MI923_30395 [Phycisphaerales bacterium]|nr:hypothetical protein [Phycisphaerales bacterium]
MNARHGTKSSCESLLARPRSGFAVAEYSSFQLPMTRNRTCLVRKSGRMPHNDDWTAAALANWAKTVKDARLPVAMMGEAAV